MTMMIDDITEPKATKGKKNEDTARLQIRPPNFKTVTFTLRGTAPYVSNKFSAEAREMMRAKQAAGSQAKKGGKRDPKDFDKCYRESMHLGTKGEYGVPASCFRQAMVSACRIVGFKMTLAKLALFVEADDFDADDASPIVLFTKGKPEKFEAATRNDTGVADIRARGKWEPGWEINLRVRYDADMFLEADIKNLLDRVGVQVGIGSGRPDSKTSCGQGWGHVRGHLVVAAGPAEPSPAWRYKLCSGEAEQAKLSRA